MSCEVYCGNYPVKFTSKDILNLFQDFEGIELLRSLKKEKKCFSFLRCVDQEQVVDVVTTMHDIDVCGRNLIVRASEKRLQDAIQQALLEDGADRHPKNKCKTVFGIISYKPGEIVKKNVFDPSSSVTYDSDQYAYFQEESVPSFTSPIESYVNPPTAPHRQIVPPIQIAQPIDHQNYNSLLLNTKAYDTSYSGSAYGAVYHGGGNNEYERKPTTSSFDESVQFINPQDTFKRLSKPGGNVYGEYSNLLGNPLVAQSNMEHQYGKRNMVDKNSTHHVGGSHVPPSMLTPFSSELVASANSQNIVFPDAEISKEDLSYVSVVNFPLGTSIRDLNILFADYNPFKVIMICNVPRFDKTPTEAIVCFTNQKDATNAILNLDNTVYRRRVLVVTDATDISMVPELLSFADRERAPRDHPPSFGSPYEFRNKH